MSQSVGQEQGVGSSLHGLFGVALHESEFFQAVGHQPADVKMHVKVFHAGFGYLQHIVVTVFHDAVNLLLALGEHPVDRHGACIVRAVVVEFAARIAEH